MLCCLWFIVDCLIYDVCCWVGVYLVWWQTCCFVSLFWWFGVYVDCFVRFGAFCWICCDLLYLIVLFLFLHIFYLVGLWFWLVLLCLFSGFVDCILGLAAWVYYSVLSAGLWFDKFVDFGGLLDLCFVDFVDFVWFGGVLVFWFCGLQIAMVFGFVAFVGFFVFWVFCWFLMLWGWWFWWFVGFLVFWVFWFRCFLGCYNTVLGVFLLRGWFSGFLMGYVVFGFSGIF